MAFLWKLGHPGPIEINKNDYLKNISMPFSCIINGKFSKKILLWRKIFMVPKVTVRPPSKGGGTIGHFLLL